MENNQEILTMEQARVYHRQLWTWMADNPNTPKCDWPGWKEVENRYPHLSNSSSCLGCMEFNQRVFLERVDPHKPCGPNCMFAGAIKGTCGPMYDLWCDSPYGSTLESELARAVSRVGIKPEFVNPAMIYCPHCHQGARAEQWQDKLFEDTAFCKGIDPLNDKDPATGSGILYIYSIWDLMSEMMEDIHWYCPHCGQSVKSYEIKEENRC